MARDEKDGHGFCGENMQRGKKRIEEADFFVGDEGEGERDEKGGECEVMPDCARLCA